MRSLRDHVDDLLRCRLVCIPDLAYTVNHEMRVRRLMGSTSTQTPDAQELEALLLLDIEERVSSILALLTERGST